MHQPRTTGYADARHEASVVRILFETAGAVGENFFREAARTLADVLDVRWVLFGQYQPGDRTTAKTIAFWDDEAMAQNMPLSLQGSVWEHLLTTGDCIVPAQLRTAFPGDSAAGPIRAEGCIGTPLKASDGTVIGFITILDDKPIHNHQAIRDAIALLAGRAGAELERLVARSLNERLGKIVEESVSEAFAFSADDFRFETVNRGARENLGYSIEELRGMTPWDLKPAYSEQQFRQFVEPLLKGEVESMQFETQHCRKDGSLYDVHVRIQYFPQPDNLFFASINDVTHQKESARRERVLINEINHRSKNLLSVVQAVAAQTAAGNPVDMPQRLERRLAALAANQDILVHNTWRSIPMRDLIRSQLDFLRHLLDQRILMEGPEMNLQAEAAQVLGMAIHELATNAIKYGALARDGGVVEIAWSLEDDGNLFRFDWVERGGPAVSEPIAKGFGSTIMIDQPCYALGATVDARFAAAGLRYGVKASASAVLDDGREGEVPAP